MKTAEYSRKNIRAVASDERNMISSAIYTRLACVTLLLNGITHKVAFLAPKFSLTGWELSTNPYHAKKKPKTPSLYAPVDLFSDQYLGATVLCSFTDVMWFVNRCNHFLYSLQNRRGVCVFKSENVHWSYCHDKPAVHSQCRRGQYRNPSSLLVSVASPSREVTLNWSHT